MDFARVLVSAGGTREPWDEVRFLGNRSTGRQGCEIARAAQDLGAAVTLVAANVETALVPSGVSVVEVETADEMLTAMLQAAREADLIVQSAAVADFRPIRVSGKITRHSDTIPVLELERTPDVLATLLSRRQAGPVLVGFGALTGSVDEVKTQGSLKAKAKGVDLLAVNQVGDGLGFGTQTNTLYFFDDRGEIIGEASGTKYEVGKVLLHLAGKIARN